MHSININFQNRFCTEEILQEIHLHAFRETKKMVLILNIAVIPWATAINVENYNNAPYKMIDSIKKAKEGHLNSTMLVKKTI